MKTIKWRVTEEEYEKILNVIKSHGARSVHQFFKDISLAIFSKEEGDLPSDDINNIDYLFYKMQFHVTEDMNNKIRGSVKKHGWTLSKEIRFRLNQTLSREPVMLENEIRELRKIRNEIVRIGQNIYYLIAQRQLLPVNDKNMWEDIKKLNALIEDVKGKVNYLAEARANICQ